MRAFLRKKSVACSVMLLTRIHSTANRARQTAGKLAALEGDYYKAVSIFIKGAEASLAGAPTGRFNVKTYLFKAGSKFAPYMVCDLRLTLDTVCQLATGVSIHDWTFW